MSGQEQRVARVRRRWAVQDEPWPEEQDLVLCGSEVYVPVGSTSNGCPIGPTLGELRESALQDERERGWARAHRALRAAVRLMGLPDPEVGRVRKIGEGLSREAFGAEVDPGVAGWPRVLVALVPLRGRRAVAGGGHRQVEREARLLTWLASRGLEFRVPGFAAAVGEGDEALLVTEFLAGLPVDLRAGRMPAVRPWQVVGRLAAAVHRIPTGDLGWLPGHATRRAHGESLVDACADLEQAPSEVARKALDWLRGHLPPDEPSALVHGDLLGQNLRLLPGEPLGVLDWERARRGDPAYDLAIVTRGVRRPFQVERGMERLLAAYAASPGSGAAPLRAAEVRFHEIALHLDWYRRALAGEEGVEPMSQVLARLRNLVRAG